MDQINMKEHTMFKTRSLPRVLRGILVALVATASWMAAQTGFAFMDGQAEIAFGGTSEIARASEWIGKEVEDSDGNAVGEISDFAFDARTGDIAYAVVAVGGLITEQHIAVSLSTLQTVPDDETLQLRVNENAWKDVPRFDDDNWPLQAAVTHPDPRRTAEFSGLDRDGSGYLDQSELRTRSDLANQQESLDSNGDGRVSHSEFAAFESNRMDDGSIQEKPRDERREPVSEDQVQGP